MGRTRSFLVSLPERIVRSLVAVAAGATHEAAEVVLPRFIRRSRLYEVSAKNLLRTAIELVGDVEREPGQPDAGELLKRKTAGNVVELSSIVALGFSPLWSATPSPATSTPPRSVGPTARSHACAGDAFTRF